MKQTSAVAESVFDCATVEGFGSTLLFFSDLDPVYDRLHAANLSRPLLSRWCLAYWMVYHAGLASWVAEQSDFWDAMRAVVFNAKVRVDGAEKSLAVRGTERRHFRGTIAVQSVSYLRERFPNPESAVEAISKPTLREVKEVVQAWPGFGPWIAFKVADMLERVLAVPVEFPVDCLSFYKQPRLGAELVAKERGWPASDRQRVAESLLRDFADDPAPPRFDRPINIQEVETILCKYKSHRSGHYPIGKDSREVSHALAGWGAVAKSL